jgi:zeta-carotene desaturase
VRVAIVGAGLAGLAAAVDLVDAGHQVALYEARPFMGGKVGSWVDEGGNHIEMGLHVFFFNYANLFALLRKVGAFENLLPKDHTHLFVNTGGDLRELDFRFALGAPFNGLKAFFTTPQLDWIDKLRNALALGTSPIVRGLVDYEGAMKTIRALDRISFQQWFVSHGGSEQSIRRMWNPIAYALGFIDCEAISARCMLTIFMMFAAKTEASKLNLLKGSPHRWLTGPILDYITQRGGRLHLRHRVSCAVRGGRPRRRWPDRHPGERPQTRHSRGRDHRAGRHLPGRLRCAWHPADGPGGLAPLAPVRQHLQTRSGAGGHRAAALRRLGHRAGR